MDRVIALNDPGDPVVFVQRRRGGGIVASAGSGSHVLLSDAEAQRLAEWITGTPVPHYGAVSPAKARLMRYPIRHDADST